MNVLLDAACVLAAVVFLLVIAVAITYQRRPPPWDDTEPVNVPRDDDD